MSGRARAGLLTAAIYVEDPTLVVISADKTWIDGDGVLWVSHHNAYVRTGQRNSLLREFGQGGAAVGFLGISNDTSPVTEATTFLNGSAAGTTANTLVKALTGVSVSDAATANPVAQGGASFTPADFTAGVFKVNKVGLLTTSTDAGTGLIDVVGGSSSTAPFNRPFSVDFTGTVSNGGTFTFQPALAVSSPAV